MTGTPAIEQVTAQRTATVHLTVKAVDLPKHMDPAIQEVLQALAAQGLAPSGPMFTYHHRAPSDTFDFEVGFPIDGEFAASGRVKAGELPAARVARAVHQGPYEELPGAWQALGAWLKEQGLHATDRFFERYLNDPTGLAPSEYRTEINRVLAT